MALFAGRSSVYIAHFRIIKNVTVNLYENDLRKCPLFESHLCTLEGAPVFGMEMDESITE